MADPRRFGRFLPPDPRVEEPYRLTPRLALRVGMLGTVALALFAVLFLRLWALQVLSGSQYLRAAQNNQLRTVRVQAPRGPILDRNGRVLVTNVAGNAVLIWPNDLPDQGRYDELKALSKIVHVPVAKMARAIRARRGDPLTPVKVKTSIHEDQVLYLYEHQSEFPGVEIAQTFLRTYPYQALAAQVLGYVGEISPDQLKRPSHRRDRAGDEIGQAGVEAAYDAYLRGNPGLAQLRVDSLGHPQSNLSLTHAPQAGHAVRLTIDVGVQRAAEQALRYGIDLAQRDGQWAANGGAIVALDPRDGSVIAMASYPTYKPSIFVGRADPNKLRPLVSPAAAKAANYPSLNRALTGLYPPGSTFKPVTALAALEEHLILPYQTLQCTGVYHAPEDLAHQAFKNWDPYVNEPMTLPVALAASCDTYFYQVGNQFFLLPPERHHPLQDWASRFGFGQKTGIEIGPEEAGLLPTPGWRQRTYTRKSDPCCWRVDRLWKPGDSIQLAIGQKDMNATPLQMARFYALVANGGKLVTPHLLYDVEQPGSAHQPPRVLRPYTAGTVLQSGVDASALAVVREGLYDATHLSFGTSSGVFGAFGVPVAGKTGTAEKTLNLDGYPRVFNQSWWCGYGPSDNPTIVVCALIENGGHGGTAAAPAALKVFEEYFHTKPVQLGTVHSD